MSRKFKTRRRAVWVFYQRYLEADRAFRLAQNEAMSWLRPEDRSSVRPIGNPGSPLRRLYEQRARAMSQLEVAYLKLRVMKQRAARPKTLLFLTANELKQPG